MGVPHLSLRLATALAVIGAAGAAAADDPPPPPATPTAPAALPAPVIRVDLGVASPVGSLGVVYSRPVAPHLGIEAGVGLGASGLQLSLMGKLRLGHGRWRFTPGVGVSLGIPVGTLGLTDGHPGGNQELRGDDVVVPWLDVDAVGVEYRSEAGWVFAASGGATTPLVRGHWDVADLGDDVAPGDVLPQLRVGFGWSY